MRPPRQPVPPEDGLQGETLAFTGRSLELFVHTIVFGLFSSLTCGLYAPWGAVLLIRWWRQKTLYRGEPLEFQGRGGQLFGPALLLALLTLFSLGLYLPWAICWLRRWADAHTTWRGEPLAFSGRGAALFPLLFFWGLLSLLTLGLASIGGRLAMARFFAAHTRIAGQSLALRARPGEFFLFSLPRLLLTLISLGLSQSWWAVTEARWLARRTQEGTAPSTLSAMPALAGALLVLALLVGGGLLGFSRVVPQLGDLAQAAQNQLKALGGVMDGTWSSPAGRAPGAGESGYRQVFGVAGGLLPADWDDDSAGTGTENPPPPSEGSKDLPPVKERVLETREARKGEKFKPGEAYYHWTDAKGGVQITDRLENVPRRFRDKVRIIPLE